MPPIRCLCPSLAALWLVAAVVVPARADQALAERSDNYAFSGGSSQALTLVREGDNLVGRWPTPAGAWDTALLALGLRTTGSTPRVELRAGSRMIVQYLDADARGMRWLNVTGLRAELQRGANLELRGHEVELEPGAATLRLFANGLDLQQPVLVLAPHPDDAEIAAFGLYSSARATVVTVTSGNAGDANYAAYFDDTAAQYLFKGYLRALDSVTVPWQGGVPPERCYNLGYFDARLASMHATPRAVVPEVYGPNDDVAPYRRANLSRLLPNGPRKNSWANLVEDLTALLRKLRPAVIVTPHPWLDSHPDHQYVTVALVEALERWDRPVTVLAYTNHASLNRYPFGPAGTVVSLPPWAGTALPVESVYSHGLDAERQRRKLFALESMHDLRLAPDEQAACGDPTAPRRPDYPRVPEVDYFRRGPRSEEIFFVFGRAGLRELVRSFLKQEAGQ
jgi:LmbE family N-acetylglucosaminyl deacetylase